MKKLIITTICILITACAHKPYNRPYLGAGAFDASNKFIENIQRQNLYNMQQTENRIQQLKQLDNIKTYFPNAQPVFVAPPVAPPTYNPYFAPTW